jgi:alpha-beta hydrolase superfamily lysophospholipase
VALAGLLALAPTVVQEARGDLPVVMVGHSMGGLIATRGGNRAP